MDPRIVQVSACVQGAIDSSPGSDSFRDLLTRLMARPDFVEPKGMIKWPYLVLDTCKALGGSAEAAVPATASVEFAVSAIDVADDLADDEWPEALVSRARALNASHALCWLAQLCALQTAETVGAERARVISNLLAQALLTACGGQDLDLSLENVVDVSEERAHEMTMRKSGLGLGLICQVGAAVGTDDPSVLELVRQFGCHVGVVGQLMDDIAGVGVDANARGSDLRRRKKTLAVAYAVRCAREEGISEILEWYEGSGPLSEGEEQRLANRMRELGAIHYTWVAADAHRRQALAVLRELARETQRKEVIGLRRLLPSVHVKHTAERV